jgi:hypothetical protein
MRQHPMLLLYLTVGPSGGSVLILLVGFYIRFLGWPVFIIRRTTFGGVRGVQSSTHSTATPVLIHPVLIKTPAVDVRGFHGHARSVVRVQYDYLVRA